MVGARAGPGGGAMQFLRHGLRRHGRRWRRQVRRCPGAGDALHERDFRVAVESNGTLPAVDGIDWLCVSPKAGTEIVQRRGDELKLVWPQEGIEPARLEGWDFHNFLVQPMDCDAREEALDAAVRLVMERPRWRLSLQTHKIVGLP